MSEHRKKLLYGLLAVILLFQGGNWLYTNYVAEPLKDRSDRIADLEKKIGDKSLNLRRARLANKKMKVWERQSLPADAELARSSYRAWLLGLVEEAKFSSPNVDSGAAQNHKGMFQSLSFSVRGQGTLDQLTKFLYEFYSADHLHQIRMLAITPVRSRGVIDVSIAIEALLLPTANSTDDLNQGRSDRLAFDALADYREIVRRNLFGVGGGFDQVHQTYLSGVTETDGELEAWFTLRASDKVVKLKAGQDLEVGPFQATVVGIEESDVILESEGERWLLSIGDNLDEAFALPPEF